MYKEYGLGPEDSQEMVPGVVKSFTCVKHFTVIMEAGGLLTCMHMPLFFYLLKYMNY